MNDHVRIGQLINIQRWQEALDQSAASLAEIPQDAHMHFLHGLALHGLGRTKDALDANDRAIALSHESVRYHEQRGILLSKLGKHKQAFDSFEHALTLDPSDVNVRGGYVEAIVRDPASINSLVKTRLIRARTLADSILVDAPDTEFAHVINAKVLLAEDKPFKAQEAAKRALKIEPNSVVGHQLMGITHREIGNTRQAGDAFVAAGKLDPTSNTSRNLLSSLGKGGAAPFGLGAYLLFRFIAKSGQAAGVPVAIVLVLVVLGFAGFKLHQSREGRESAKAALSPEARSVLEADKKLR